MHLTIDNFLKKTMILRVSVLIRPLFVSIFVCKVVVEATEQLVWIDIQLLC